MLLTLIWGAWRPVLKTLPPDLASPQTREELQRLPAGQTFVLEGWGEPADATPRPEWQGRFAYVHKQRQDLSNSGGKTVRIVTVEDRRPAVRWNWASELWILPAGSYALDHAPRVLPRFWPRKWLWTTRVDDWDATSTGLQAGEPAIALGRISAAGQPLITDLMQAPLEQTMEVIGVSNRDRWRLIFAAKLLLTVFALSFLFTRRKPQARLSSKDS
ncbi:MAG TPA: hypothetical protein VGD88_12650 [Opitutaceae bacterium]